MALTSSISYLEKKQRSRPTKSELDLYLEGEIDFENKPLLWWKNNRSRFPTIARMARDFLSIQAHETFVPKCNTKFTDKNICLHTYSIITIN
eukprot:gene6597-7661_t